MNNAKYHLRNDHKINLLIPFCFVCVNRKYNLNDKQKNKCIIHQKVMIILFNITKLNGKLN